MKITFDSNTWRKVATPDNFPEDPIIEATGQLDNLLMTIRFYLSYLTLII